LSPYFREMGDKKVPKKFQKFQCKSCDYYSNRYSQYERHLKTIKHQMVTNGDNLVPNSSDCHLCSCGKEFKYRQGLHRHKNKCTGVQTNNVSVTTTHESNVNSSINNETVNAILQDNAELRKILIQQQEQHNKQIQELIPKIQATTINNTNTNSNNTTNKFNLNFFLNEQCKNAISIQTFIRDLNIGIKELEHMGNVGYLQGMISIMSNTLGTMDIYKRPVHCTDLKRETIYIKDGDTWKKDNANNDELKRVIDDVADKNYRNLTLWEQQHPEAFECDTPDNIEYCKIALESLGGGNNNEEQAKSKLNKIVKHVVRDVYVK